jgi:hypothetical protein
MPFLYTAFGLSIESDLPIPGLESLAALPATDLNIWQAERPGWMRELAAPTGAPWRTGLMRNQNGEPLVRMWKFTREKGTFIHVRYQSGNEFLIDEESRNIWVFTREPRSPEYNAVYLLGPILALVLRLRGVVCLHASAVVVDDKAIAFVGAPGAGKSTTAAAFAHAGYRILADDVVALSQAGDKFIVWPAYPRVRLWSESLSGLFGRPVILPLLAPDFPKHYLDLMRDGRFQGKPVVLDAIYRLAARVGNSNDISIQSMSPREALITGIENTFGSLVLERDQRAAEFRFLGDLAAHVPVLRLIATDDLAKLDSLVDALTRDVRSRTT